jgi:hypothetical protein
LPLGLYFEFETWGKRRGWLPPCLVPSLFKPELEISYWIAFFELNETVIPFLMERTMVIFIYFVFEFILDDPDSARTVD